MRTLFALLMLTAAAQAQTYITTGGTYSIGGICMLGTTATSTSTYSDVEQCLNSGGSYTAPNQAGVSVTRGLSAGTFISNVGRQCDEGWTLVATGSGYKCARELREPK